MKPIQKHINWIKEIVILILLLVCSNLALAFSSQVETSFNVETCDYSLELENGFDSQISEHNFSDSRSFNRRISIPENATTKRKVYLAAKTSTKLLPQFTKSTIDDAVNLVMRNSNDVKHIFAGKHNLGSLVNRLGGQENTIRAVLNAGNGTFPASGVFKNLPVNVGGQTVYLRGSVVNGVPRIGTMFIP